MLRSGSLGGRNWGDGITRFVHGPRSPSKAWMTVARNSPLGAGRITQLAVPCGVAFAALEKLSRHSPRVIARCTSVCPTRFGDSFAESGDAFLDSPERRPRQGF